MCTKVVSFFIFFQDLSNKKKFKKLRPKMTKIASRGGGGVLPSRQRPRKRHAVKNLEKSGLEPAAPNRLYGRSEEPRFIDSAKSPSTKIGFIGEFQAQAFQSTRETTEDVDVDIRRKQRLDCEHVNVIRTNQVLSPDRTRPDRWLSEMHERRGRLAWVRQYCTWK